MGTDKGLSLAEQLKKTADSKHVGKVNKEVESIVSMVILKAEKAAQAGDYYVDHYDERLGTREVDNAVKRILSEQGFTVSVAEDTSYSQHAGKTMMYVKASWK
jgi:hypothetical protein